MEKRVLELLTSHGTLVPPDTIDFILKKKNPEKYVTEIMKHFHEIPLFLTVDLLKAAEVKAGFADQNVNEKSLERVEGQIQMEHLGSDTVILMESHESTVTKKDPLVTTGITSVSKSVEVKGLASSKKRPLAKEYDGEIKILKDVTGQSTTEGTLKDFTKYFQERFRALRKILQNQRREVMGSAEISRLRNHPGPVKFIGMINDVRPTKQGHIILELEDESDSISALINNNSPLINMNFICDEVVCVLGKFGKNDLIYVEDIIRPDTPIAKNQNKADIPLNCLFMADIHNGSKTFLHKAWGKFINWLNGKYVINGSEQFLDNLKYIVISGDIADGIGIYPNQEAELEITDIYAQYEDLAIKFQEIPDHIELVIQPGNHDAVRPAEPQPAFPKEITDLFSNKIKFIGNPCYFSIDNVEILSYHGRSMDDFVMQIPNISYNLPLKIMKEMLIRRHLAPVYGQRTPIAPEHYDYLLIEKIPDIFVTGHIHKTAVETYRDISLINASAWQAQTSYQKMMNFNPEPGKVILAELQSRRLQILNFA